MSFRPQRRMLGAAIVSVMILGLGVLPGAGNAGAAKGKADLTVTSMSSPPVGLEAAATFNLKHAVQNKGSRAVKPSRTLFYLSSDTKKSSGDQKIAENIVPRLKPKRSLSGIASLTLPNTALPGEYYVVACADALTKIRESNERNNCRASAVFTVVLPPSQDLIEDDLDAGVIDYPTSLLYRAYALFWDERLPPRYDGGGSTGEDAGFFLEVEGIWDQLTPKDRAAFEPFLVRPTDPKSIFGPAEETQAGRRLSSALDAEDTTTCLTFWEATRGDHFAVWSCRTGDAASDEDMRASVLATAESYWALMTKPSPAGMGVPIDDGDGWIDIYVLDTNQCREREGRCLKIEGDALAIALEAAPRTTNSAGNAVSSGYIMLGRDRVQNLDELKPDFVHEFFHVLQFAHNTAAKREYFGTSDTGRHLWGRSWFYEASAMWAEWWYAPQFRDRAHGHYVYSFQPSDAPLIVDTPDVHMYGAYIWPFFMQQEAAGSPSPIFEAWVKIEAAPNPVALNEALDKQLSFSEHFRDFAVRNLNLDLAGNPLENPYWEQDAGFPRDEPPRISNDNLISVKGPDSGPTEIRHLAAQYDRYFIDTGVGQVTFDFSTLEPAVDLHHLDVDAIVKTGGTWRRIRVPASTFTLCRDRPDENVSEMYLVLSNHDKQFAGAFIQGSYKIQAEAARCGGDLSGSMTFSRHVTKTTPGCCSKDEQITVNTNLSLKLAEGGLGYVDNGTTYTISYSNHLYGHGHVHSIHECDYDEQTMGSGSGPTAAYAGTPIEDDGYSLVTGKRVTGREILAVLGDMSYTFTTTKTWSNCDNSSGNYTSTEAPYELDFEESRMRARCEGEDYGFWFTTEDPSSSSSTLDCSWTVVDGNETTEVTLTGSLSVGG